MPPYIIIYANHSTKLFQCKHIFSLKLKFVGVEHRIEFVGKVNDREFYNDSKATNPEASIVAINSFENKKVVLIAGGRDKKTTLKDTVFFAFCYLVLQLIY